MQWPALGSDFEPLLAATAWEEQGLPQGLAQQGSRLDGSREQCLALGLRFLL